ncbi:MAG: SRPBCC family protein [Bdellovibrionales bacterium]|nr:SRPBCC family protein [Bdellovibrionales bacterium]
MAHLQISQLIPATRFEVFDYLTDPSHLPFLMAPSIDVQVLSPEVDMKRGTEAHFNMTRLGMTQSIRFRIEDVLRGSRLTYRQVEGLFAAWTHTMKFDEHGEKETLVTDLVDYQVPLGLFGHLADDLLIKGDMRKLLAHRLQKAREHFDSLN